MITVDEILKSHSTILKFSSFRSLLTCSVMVFIHSVLRFHNILEPKILTFLKQTRQDLSQKRKVECKREKYIFFVAFNELKSEKKNLHADLSITWSLR